MNHQSIHQQIAEVTIDLRSARDVLATSRIRIEQEALDQAGGPKSFGANEDDRQRRLALVLANDETYRDHLRRVRFLEAKLDALQADLADYNDERRADEWRIRARLAEALSHTAHTVDEPATDSVMDLVTDRELDRRDRKLFEAIAEQLEATRQQTVDRAHADTASLEDLEAAAAISGRHPNEPKLFEVPLDRDPQPPARNPLL